MNQLKAGAILNYAVIGLNTIVGLLYTPYMLRMLGQSEYGLYALIASVISYLTVLDLGLGNAIVRYTAKFRAEGKVNEQYGMFGMFLVLYSIIGLLALLLGVGLYINVDTLFGNTMTPIELERARIMMAILVLNLVVTFPMSIFGSIITAYERFVFPKVISILSISLNTITMICLLHMGYKAVAMVEVNTVFNVLTLITNYVYCRKKLKIRILFGHFEWGFLKEVAIYSFWIFLNVIMDRIYWSTGQFVLGAIVGTTAVAIFAVGIQLHSMYMLMSSAISSVFLPKVTRMVVQGNNAKEVSDLFIKTGRIQNIVVGGVLLGFILFGKSFIILWAGPDYELSYVVTLMFFSCLYVPLIQSLGVTILQARNQMYFRSILYVCLAVMSLVFQMLMTRFWGIVGCTAAITGAVIIGQGFVINIYYKKIQNIDIYDFWHQILRMNIAPILLTVLFAVLIMNFHIQLNNWFSLSLGMIVYSTAYVLLLYRFSLNEEEKVLMASPLKSMFKLFTRNNE